MSIKEHIAHYPKGFRPRRGLNWVSIGLMYATYYMCRYNFSMATDPIRDELGFDAKAITDLWFWWSIAYGTGQLINGLVSDRFGGKKCLLVGAVGTIIISLLIGLSPAVNMFWSFALLMMVNAYFQSFGAPGFVKINAAWFRRDERGTFAGIFGGMIQAGQIAIKALAPFILSGFGTLIILLWTVYEGPTKIEPGQWRLLFIIPPMFTTAAAVFLFFAVKESPEDAGYPDDVVVDEIDDSDGTTTSIKDSFTTIFTNPFVWLYAVAYMATGAVRHSSDLLANLFFADVMGFDMKKNLPYIAVVVLGVIPLVGFLGSLISGVVSDKIFGGRRGPVAMGLYFIIAIVLGSAAYLVFSGSVSATASGIFIGCSILILISFTNNATHSLVGAAAPMDIGGKKMAGFASGVIDSFQYYGSAICLSITGPVLKAFTDMSTNEVGTMGWLYWFAIMGGFAVMGGFAMVLLLRKQKRLGRQH